MADSLWTPSIVPSPRQTGFFVASAATSQTFSPSLVPRSSVDQGIITALSVGSVYLVTSAIEDASRTLADHLEKSGFLANQVTGEGRRLWFAIGTDAALIPLAWVSLRLLPGSRDPEATIPLALSRSLVRQVLIAGSAGSLLAAAHAAQRAVDLKIGTLPGGIRLAQLPASVPLGFVAAWVSDLNRRGRDEGPGRGGGAGPTSTWEGVPGDRISDAASIAKAELTRTVAGAVEPVNMVKSIAIAGAIAGTLSGLVIAESGLERLLGKNLRKVLPGSEAMWHRVARTTVLGGAALGFSLLWDRTMQRIEGGTLVEEAAYGYSEGRKLAPATVSGSRNSLVSWQSLGREGRRHVLAGVGQNSEIADFTPFDDSIETVMEESAKAEPVQVYVGLDSAASARDRVALALAEMEKLGAFDRSLIVLVSPTGTGYVNYVALAALQYLTRGDVATVTMQYSRRPSPLALTQVGSAREQNRRLWLEIVTRLRNRPGKRPRVVVFGESLGALTSQDVFLGWGTLGPEALGIERALWIGTPHASKWAQQVRDPHRLEVDSEATGVFNDFEELEALSPAAREKLRYVLVSHDNDGVTSASADLLLKRPAWLTRSRAALRHTTPPGASPRGIPQGMRWIPITSFFQSVVDMKNSQVPGDYRANAHDYRPDLARFISEVYELPVEPRILAKVEAALERREATRELLFAEDRCERQLHP